MSQVPFGQLGRHRCEKWMLPLTDGSTHAVLMPHVDRAALDEFLADLRAVSVSRPRDGDA